ncbi:YxlC family protein [Bacillus sp. SD088]|uniref:YxlC family protein n=1 Tax=Bacillus sp. SD088 TaxID=2782012 RepID=UPI001A9783FC|nr:YxlC family protein [Bacillus sp. SD088]MBO0991788.1 YxlC family protein [Bacillus sp. SD088]
MKDSKEQEWLTQFKQDLEKLEKPFEAKVPEQGQILRVLEDFKIKRKRAFRRELAIFLITAIFILISYSMLALKLMPIFIWIQGMLIGGVPVMFIVERKRRKKQNEVSDYGF